MFDDEILLLFFGYNVTLNGVNYVWTHGEKFEDGAIRIRLATIEVDNSVVLKTLALKPPCFGYIGSRTSYGLLESCGCIYCIIVYKLHRNEDKITGVKCMSWI